MKEICKNALKCIPAFLLIALATSAQIDTPRIRPENDVDNLFQRAAASRFVVVGTVLKREAVGQRLTEAEKQSRIRRAPDGSLSMEFGGMKIGSLFTIRVDQTVCRQSEFGKSDRTAQKVTESGEVLQVFIPRDEPLWVDGHEREWLFERGRYLLFLLVPDQKSRKRWFDVYELDPYRVYYRGEERSRGVVPLEEPVPGKKLPDPSPVLGRVTQLCEALRPPELAQKLAALRKLAKTDDSVLKQEAEYGIAALQRSQH